MVALERAGIPVEKYYASEIENKAIKVSNKNYPDIIQLGDINNWRNWNIDWKNIDLVIGGSPCQGFSFCGKQLNFEDPRSKLFFVYVDILNHIKKSNPNVKFLLENVGSASAKDKKVINETLGCMGVAFNSQLLSAQNRNRVYWTNFDFEVPTDRKEVYMQDILEDSVSDKYYLTQKMYDCIMSPATKGWQSGKMEINLKIARPLTATMHKMHRADTDNYISTEYKPVDKTNVRRLTPLECERLQTLPDNYTEGISDTNRYKCIGNGWTVDVIAHILSYLKF